MHQHTSSIQDAVDPAEFHTHPHEHPLPRRKAALWVVACVVAALGLIWRSFVAVDETEYVIVTQFGRPTATLRDPGLHVIAPWQSVLRVDRRLQLYDPRASEFLTSDPKNVLLDVYVCWRVTDPLQFLRRVGDFVGGEARIHDIVWAELAAEVGQRPLSDFLSDETPVRSDEIMTEITRRARERVRSGEFGLDIVDVRIKRINFPEQNRQSVFDRMRAERERVARLYRAQGEEEALKIRANADLEKARLLADAERDAELTRGKAEQEAIRIYAAAHGRDPQFYRFLRSLEVLQKVLTERSTLVLSADSEVFRVLRHPMVESADRRTSAASSGSVKARNENMDGGKGKR